MSTTTSSMLPEITPSDSLGAMIDSAVSQEASQTSPSESEVQKEEAKKKKLFGLLGKKKDDKTSDPDALSPNITPTASPAAANMQSPSASTPAKPIPRSVSPGPQPHMTPPSQPLHFPGSPQSHMSAASPSRYVRSSSPRLHSPASSQIFERNVQEAPLPDDLQAAIPHHIQTEDHIPAILEASSHAITDEKLNPDEVEIVMHSLHQPAATTIASPEGGVASGTLSPLSLGHGSDVPMLSPSVIPDNGQEDQANHYGALDNTDHRRLSFISFADVVQGEHAHDGSGSMHNLPKELHMSMMSNTTNRSPSPVRSPASSHGAGDFGLSPPTSGTPSVKGVDITSPQSPPLVGGELTVETMRQALQKTGSKDTGAAMSPISPVEKGPIL